MLISLATFGQDRATETHKLLIGVTVSPDICFRTLKNTDGSSTSDWIIDLRNDSESPKFSYSSGLSLCYHLTSHWAFETGLQYSNKGFKYVNSNPTFVDPYGYPDTTEGPAPTRITFIDNFNYLDIPLRTIFSIGNKKVRFISSIGITTNILISPTITSIIKYDDEHTDHQTQKAGHVYKSINLSPTASIGIDWQLFDNFNVCIEPTFRYGLLKIINTSITAYLWSGGVNFTCYYRLK